MQLLLRILTEKEQLLASDMVGVVTACYVFLLIFIILDFINIYTIDKGEFLQNIQKCIDFKRRIPFIIMYSKTKNIVSKKTLIFEIIGYAIGIGIFTSMIFSFFLTIDEACILLLICFIITFIYTVIISFFHVKIQKICKNSTL